MTANIHINPDGTLAFIWQDDLASLLELGTGQIKRASHVEPTADGQWEADLSPVGGPMLGPYKLRGEALAAEVAWLNERLAEV